MRCPLAYSAGAWGLRPHGGDDHVAFAAHHRRHTERLPCALRSQCPISRSHPSTAHPTGPQTPVPPKGTSPPRLAHPTSFPLSPTPPTNATSISRQLSRYCSRSTSPLSDGRRSRSMHVWNQRTTTSGRQARCKLAQH